MKTKSRYTILVKIWKWLKLLNSVPFYIRTILRATSMISQLVEQRTSNPKVVGLNPTWATEFFNNSVGHYQCQLSSLRSVPFMKKSLVNHVFIQIWSFWLTFTVLQWIKTNFKISQFSWFLLRSEFAIYFKIW